MGNIHALCLSCDNRNEQYMECFKNATGIFYGCGHDCCQPTFPKYRGTGRKNVDVTTPIDTTKPPTKEELIARGWWKQQAVTMWDNGVCPCDACKFSSAHNKTGKFCDQGGICTRSTGFMKFVYFGRHCSECIGTADDCFACKNQDHYREKPKHRTMHEKCKTCAKLDRLYTHQFAGEIKSEPYHGCGSECLTPTFYEYTPNFETVKAMPTVKVEVAAGSSVCLGCKHSEKNPNQYPCHDCTIGQWYRSDKFERRED